MTENLSETTKIIFTFSIFPFICQINLLQVFKRVLPFDDICCIKLVLSPRDDVGLLPVINDFKELHERN